MNETLFPVNRAAQRLGISVWTLRKKAYVGEVTSVKIGVKLLIPESEIDRLIGEGTRPRKTDGIGPDPTDVVRRLNNRRTKRIDREGRQLGIVHRAETR